MKKLAALLFAVMMAMATAATAFGFTLEFGEFAAFVGESSPSQQEQNFYFTTEEIPQILEQYTDVDFEVLTFKGNPSFARTGAMVFHALGGKDTAIYRYADGVLEQLDSVYDEANDRVIVDGIKKLDCFVIASKSLDLSTVEEGGSVSSNDAEEQTEDTVQITDTEANPNTGAC